MLILCTINLVKSINPTNSPTFSFLDPASPAEKPLLHPPRKVYPEKHLQNRRSRFNMSILSPYSNPKAKIACVNLLSPPISHAHAQPPTPAPCGAGLIPTSSVSK